MPKMKSISQLVIFTVKFFIFWHTFCNLFHELKKEIECKQKLFTIQPTNMMPVVSA